jgi:hypothetical protein
MADNPRSKRDNGVQAPVLNAHDGRDEEGRRPHHRRGHTPGHIGRQSASDVRTNNRCCVSLALAPQTSTELQRQTQVIGVEFGYLQLLHHVQRVGVVHVPRMYFKACCTHGPHHLG